MIKPIKTLVVEDQPIYRNGIIKVISSLEFVNRCDEAENGQVALDKFKNTAYDVVFMDIEMEVMDGVTATRLIKEKYPQTLVIILTLYDTKRLIVDFFEMGVNAYILKTTDEAELVNALTLILSEGRQYFTEKVYKIWADYLINKSAKPLPLSDRPYFGPRELEIIKLFCQQHTAKSIASILQIAESTVNNSRSHIMRKMGVDNIVGLVMYAVKQGIYFPE